MTTPESSENREIVGSGTAESVAAHLRELAAAYVAAEEKANAEWDRLISQGKTDPFQALAVYDETNRLREKWASTDTARAVLEALL